MKRSEEISNSIDITK